MLVELKHEGNVGAIARVMKNFGFHELRLVNCAQGEDARKRAMHANDILANAKNYSNFETAIEDLDIVAGTSGVASDKERHYLRHPLSPEGFLRKYSKFSGKIGLVFGREDFGLLNEELAICDVLINIGTSEEYPIMNVSHAAAVLLYVLRKKTGRRAFSKPEKLEIREMHAAFGELLDAINYPEHRKRNAQIMFRRLIGRAAITKLETSMLIGVFRRAAKRQGGKNED
ncbi:MAG: RNA methyltransferase [Thermoplasmata archaeon]|nr:RNA methyltransferase [Thermoplasmata archaeon]